jgi:hypothetical protein
VALSATGAPLFSRYLHAAAYDSLADRVIVYGGFHLDSTQRIDLDETWALALSPSLAWQQLVAPGGPPPATSMASAFDDVHERWVLYGGRTGGVSEALAGTWALAFPAGMPMWQSVADPVPVPAGRAKAIAVYDPRAQRFLMSDGAGGSPPPDDFLWSRDLGATIGPWTIAPIAGILPPAPRTEDYPPSRPTFAPAGFDPSRGAYRFFSTTPIHAMFELLPEDPPRWRLRPSKGGAPVTGLLDAWIGCVFDSTNARTYAFNTDTLWTLADGDSDTWSRIAIQGERPPSRQSAFVYLDTPRQRILVLGGQDEINGLNRFDEWVLALTDPPNWIHLADTCAVVGIHSAPIVRDSRRDRLLFQGGHSYGYGTDDSAQLLALDLNTLTWTFPVPSGADLVHRHGHAAVYDSSSDRLVLLGGRNWYGWLDALVQGVQFGPADPTGVAEDFDLDEAFLPSLLNPLTFDFSHEGVIREVGLDTLWTIRLGGIAPPFRVLTTSPQPWVRGATTVLSFDVLNLGSSASTYHWEVRSTRDWPGFPLSGGTSAGGLGAAHVIAGIAVPDSAAYGSNRLSIVVNDVAYSTRVDSSHVMLVDPAFPLHPLLTGPGDWIWKPGLLDSIPMRLVNPDDSMGHAIVLDVSGDRAWPGLPATRSLLLGPSETLNFKLAVVVPDTAANGATYLHVTAAWQERPEVLAVCDVHLHDIITPTRVTLVEAVPDPATGGVRLAWWIPAGAGSLARVERRTESEGWTDLGSASADASACVVFLDRTPPAGTRVAYRAGSDCPEGMQWSDETWIETAPAPASVLAFAAGRRTLVARGPLDLSFTLPRSGRARIEVFDVHGRRVASRSLDAGVAGAYSLRLAEAGVLRSGVYFLRLAQGVQHVDGRAIVLGAQ